MSQKQAETIEVPEKLAVFEDKRTKARTAAFPFTFPDGTHGVVTVTRLNEAPWNPSQDMKNIIINWA